MPSIVAKLPGRPHDPNDTVSFIRCRIPMEVRETALGPLPIGPCTRRKDHKRQDKPHWSMKVDESSGEETWWEWLS